jgi:hypothetical protein
VMPDPGFPWRAVEHGGGLWEERAGAARWASMVSGCGLALAGRLMGPVREGISFSVFFLK